MVVLLDALADDPARHRRRRAALGLIAGMVASVGFGIWDAVERDAHACTGMDARLVGVWDDERRAAGEAAFAATRLSYAASTWARVETRLDAYTEDWLAARIAACEATRRGEQSGDLLDRRMLCLDERLARVEATVELFASADATVVDNAIRAVAGLPSLAPCADTKALLAELPPPDDPQVAAGVEALEATLLEVDALYQAGRFEAGLALVESVLHEAEPLGYAPLRAHAQQHRGELLEELGDYEAAELALQQAYVDPDDGQVCPTAEASRPLFDNVCDYSGLADSGARDQQGDAGGTQRCLAAHAGGFGGEFVEAGAAVVRVHDYFVRDRNSRRKPWRRNEMEVD